MCGKSRGLPERSVIRDTSRFRNYLNRLVHLFVYNQDERTMIFFGRNVRERRATSPGWALGRLKLLLHRAFS